MILKIFILAVIVINIFSFSLMGIDKKKAQKSKWRIKESTLLLSAFILGGIGSFSGMQFFRHKTRHMKFIILVPLAIIENIAIFIFVYLKFIH